MKRIETERLILRSWEKSDYKDLYEYGKNEKVGPNAGWPPHKDEEESKKIIGMFQKSEDSVFAVELKGENKVIGGVGIHSRRPDEKYQSENQAEIGFVLNPAYWGNGYIPETVFALLDYGFNSKNLETIWCGHFENNNNSKRVNEKCGFNYKFKKEEIKPLLNNKKVTTLYYNITKDEYLNFSNKTV